MKRFCLVLAIVGFASGCAFTPQAVQLQPTIQVTDSSLGAGHAVQISVVDERFHSTLGTRGAQDGGAELTVADDLTSIVRSAIGEGLRRQGFEPKEEQTGDRRELRIEVRNLDYRIISGFWAGTLRTECGLKAICIRGTKRPYEQLHRGEFQETIVVVPGDEANNEYVNAALSNAVNAVLGDAGLVSCLAADQQPDDQASP